MCFTDLDTITVTSTMFHGTTNPDAQWAPRSHKLRQDTVNIIFALLIYNTTYFGTYVFL